MLDKIPFKVSARTARLIGRENVATAKGAIIELVKNGYDADSPFSIVLIDNRYGVYHNRLDKELYEKYLSLGIEESLLTSIYQLNEDAYYERPDVDIEKIGVLKKHLQSYSSLYIIDAGEGMTDSIIRNCWMTIGTDNKSTHFTTHGGRVKAGAKGIGRFALDKLGERCEMFTFFDPTVHEDKNEDDEAIKNVYEDLGVLVPPSENRDFTISLVSLDSPQKYGELESSFCDDFDYKIVAHADADQNVNIRIYRNEYNVEAIPLSFYNRENQQEHPYRREDFMRGYWDATRTFGQLIPGFRDSDVDGVLAKIGTFDFVFYYLKRSATKNDEARFFYRQCPYNLRKSWLDKFGGIKLFRDNFRVRPYGEKNDSAFDWLGIGMRKNNSPAGIAKKQGGYRVESENIAGSILISRLANIDFEDKSSREGLQENKTFAILKQIIIGIIRIFEDDRSLIARELDADDQERNGAARDREKAEELANKIIEEHRKKRLTSVASDDENSFDYQLNLLATVNEQKNEEIKQLHEEQRILRALASSGLMLASFAHDLSKYNANLDNRYDNIVELLNGKITIEDFPAVRRKNPFMLLNQAKENDSKMQRWFSFSTDIVKKDKRKRKAVALVAYFEKLEETWAGILGERDIHFLHDRVADVAIRAFEIDLDSIFYNLISNSVEAFIRLRENRDRVITVCVEQNEKSIVFTYRDSGPGLSDEIVNPTDIFKPLFTTKRSTSTGEEIGTGLGMWLVKLISEDNDARVILLTPREGFGVQIIFPIKYKR